MREGEKFYFVWEKFTLSFVQINFSLKFFFVNENLLKFKLIFKIYILIHIYISSYNIYIYILQNFYLNIVFLKIYLFKVLNAHKKILINFDRSRLFTLCQHFPLSSLTSHLPQNLLHFSQTTRKFYSIFPSCLFSFLFFV